MFLNQSLSSCLLHNTQYTIHFVTNEIKVYLSLEGLIIAMFKFFCSCIIGYVFFGVKSFCFWRKILKNFKNLSLTKKYLINCDFQTLHFTIFGNSKKNFSLLAISFHLECNVIVKPTIFSF